ncbi:DUF6134 family protein [Geminicoccaceae bacterium 1502E]|nr:DUF6134 family protein [Geminicoccaceae bacterium 1502E]
MHVMADPRAAVATARAAGLTRRRFGGLTLALGALGLPLPALGFEPVDRTFEIRRKGSAVGFHRIAFERGAAGLAVTTEIDIAVKFAFITAFRYSQRGRDVWQDEKLVASEVATDDDGNRSRVVLEAVDGKLRGVGPKGGIEMPLGDMTDLCWWNPGIVRRERLLDAQTGIVSILQSWEVGSERIELESGPVEARGYGIEASQGRAGEVWYDPDGRWIKALLHTRGEVLEYRLLA